jgi:hypothetical protein
MVATSQESWLPLASPPYAEGRASRTQQAIVTRVPARDIWRELRQASGDCVRNAGARIIPIYSCQGESVGGTVRQEAEGFLPRPVRPGSPGRADLSRVRAHGTRVLRLPMSQGHAQPPALRCR